MLLPSKTQSRLNHLGLFWKSISSDAFFPFFKKKIYFFINKTTPLRLIFFKNFKMTTF
jgi:hypothetical protein